MCVISSAVSQRFIVLDVIGGLVERQKHDNDLRRRFEESEAKVALLEFKLARRLNDSNFGSGLPMNTLIAEGSLDMNAGVHGPDPMRK
jgi:hypothetical protein